MSRDAAAISNDAVFDLLGDWRCRLVLDYLRGRPGRRVPYDALLEDVVAAETAAYGGQVPLEYSASVSEDLRHRVLPRLAVHGLVEFDPTATLVRYRHDHVIEEILGVAATNDARRRRRAR